MLKRATVVTLVCVALAVPASVLAVTPLETERADKALDLLDLNGRDADMGIGHDRIAEQMSLSIGRKLDVVDRRHEIDDRRMIRLPCADILDEQSLDLNGEFAALGSREDGAAVLQKKAIETESEAACTSFFFVGLRFIGSLARRTEQLV